MSLILNIETATTVCSVALFSGHQLLAEKELDAGYTHAENLHGFISEVLIRAEIKTTDLDAIAVSQGPGSFTGLRIGASTAKGLAYGLQIPLITVDTLQIMCAAAKKRAHDNTHYAPMIDARRMEVYTAVFDKDLKPVKGTSAEIISEESVGMFASFENIVFFGNGMDKSREILSTLASAQFLPGIGPSARYMGELALRKFERRDLADTAYFEPFYLKDFLAGKKKALK
jgi:tRNA threonylcarbamoyladenosine biosynthesis protein TsaB